MPVLAGLGPDPLLPPALLLPARPSTPPTAQPENRGTARGPLSNGHEALGRPARRGGGGSAPASSVEGGRGSVRSVGGGRPQTSGRQPGSRGVDASFLQSDWSLGSQSQGPLTFGRMVVIRAPGSLSPAAVRPRQWAGPRQRAAYRVLDRPGPLAAWRGDRAGLRTMALERPVIMLYFAAMCLLFLPSSSTLQLPFKNTDLRGAHWKS